MNKAAIYHHCGDTWCYALDDKRLHIRLRTAAADIDRIELVHGDPFEWRDIGGTHVWASECADMTKAGTNGVHDFWEATVTPPYSRLKYWFIIHSGRTACEFGEKGIVDAVDRWNTWNTFIFPYIHAEETFRAPEWTGDTVWYQIFPERFANGNPALNPDGTKDWQHGPVTNHEFYGGDLPGITAKLDHIASLGVNGIYLTPIFESPSVHKYDTKDYLKIDPAFGTEDDLKKLVSECHKRGIKLILDAVFNHSGTKFAPWQDVLKNGESSRYRDWFVIDRFPLMPEADAGAQNATGAGATDAASGNIRRPDDSHEAGFRTFAFTTGMPKLNTWNPELREYLLGVAEYYVRECGIDGWRLDVANEVPHDFWRAFRARVKKANPDAYIVGEIWHNSIDWLQGDQYDAIMNYHFGQAIESFLNGTEEIPDGMALARRMTTLEQAYPVPAIRAGFNLLDSHDTARIINRLGGNLAAARQAWLILALLPGSPCFYYGSEFGVDGGHDPDCRRCMPWDESAQKEGQLAFIKEIIALRRSNAELVNKGKREWLFDRRVPGLFGFRITAETGEDCRGASAQTAGTDTSLTILVNRSGKTLSAKKFTRLLNRRELCNPALADISPNGWLVLRD
jgi:glycosidase